MLEKSKKKKEKKTNREIFDTREKRDSTTVTTNFYDELRLL